MGLSSASIDNVEVAVYTLRTERPESDGTFEWDKTIMVVVQVAGGGHRGLGYTYANEATGRFVAETLAHVVMGRDVFDVAGAHRAMRAAVRNLGQAGVSAMAISAVDTALWDLKARIIGVPLSRLLGELRERCPVYGSGGFTSYGVAELQVQLGGWVARGIPRVKMKVGRHPERDLERVHAALQAVGHAELFVDANGAYDRKQAIEFAQEYGALGVRWFEEPVSSDDLEGLAQVTARAPMEVAAGEYGYGVDYYRRMLQVGAVDVVQADITRCGGVTGFLAVAQLCHAAHVPLSAHCAPALTVHAALAAPALRHLEYFHDHVRFESRIFDGLPRLDHGALVPDSSRPGLGLVLKEEESVEVVIEEERPLPH